MAGDWIKMRIDIGTSPKVVRIASALSADRLRVVGGLHAVWCLFDAHSEDGKLDGYTPDALDELIGFSGFAAAMISVGWLEDGGEFLAVPRFGDHNGQSAKRRAMETERKRTSRKMSALDADEKRTREEKRREETTTSHSDACEAEPTSLPTRKGIVCGLLRKAGMADAAPHYLTDETWGTILAKRTNEEILELAKAKMAAKPNQRIGLKYIAKALMDDPEPIEPNQRGSPRMSHADQSKLAAARAIFGTDIEAGSHADKSGRIIDISTSARPALGG